MNNERFKIDILDIDKFVQNNECKEISNPVFFKANSIPTDDGLLSNEIFGITKNDRGNIFAYIKLNGTFINPLIFTAMVSMNNKIKDLVYGTRKFTINSEGDLIEDPNGKTGLDYFINNMNKIKFKRTDSAKRDVNIKFLHINKKLWAMDKMVVIPPYYRDVNTTSSGSVGVGEINEIYNKLIVSCKALKETEGYGFGISNSLKGRIQDIIVLIYRWFVDEPNLSKKYGIIRKAIMANTTDRGSRLVLSGADIDTESYKDMDISVKKSLIPLASILTNVLDYIIFNCRRFFENEFTNGEYKYIDKKGKIMIAKIKDPDIQFSDERIKKEIDRFVKGFSNRLIPIKIETVDRKTITMKFKGRRVNPKNIDKDNLPPIFNRDLTWCDLFYIAAEEACNDKHMFITRYPLESFYGQFPTQIVINSTIKKDPMWIDGKVYPRYPYITQDMIGTNTSNLFVDTLQPSNLMLEAIGGDYDGDMTTNKVSFYVESNQEMDRFINSKAHYININGITHRSNTNEVIQSIYNLTKVLSDSKLTEPIF